jgi:pyruvate/2-oxoacid:ferredoxin oxidoreductase beta subunit
MSERKAYRWRVINHGVEHSQYFQGCGTAFTEFTDCVTGIGDNPKEAMEDALEQLASGGWDVDGIENNLKETPSLSDRREEEAEERREAWEQLQRDNGIPDVDEATEEQYEAGEYFDPDDYEDEDEDDDGDERWYHVSVLVREFTDNDLNYEPRLAAGNVDD